MPASHNDPESDRLSSYFEELYAYLVEHNVPEECLPSPWHILRRVLQCVDDDLVHEWLDDYVALEADSYEEGSSDSENSSSSSTPKKRRPSYLRPLDNLSKDNEDSDS